MKNTYKENPSQVTQILLYLKEGNKLTALDALDKFGCWRLSGRINDIRNMDIKVEMELITTRSGKVVGEYSLGKTYTQGKLFWKAINLKLELWKDLKDSLKPL